MVLRCQCSLVVSSDHVWRRDLAWPCLGSATIWASARSGCTVTIHGWKWEKEVPLWNLAPSLPCFLFPLPCAGFTAILPLLVLSSTGWAKNRTSKNSPVFWPTLYILFIFVSYVPPNSLNETQPKPATCSEVRASWKCMFKMWGMPSP